MDSSEDLLPIVFDNGSRSCKFGFAGEDAPRSSMPFIVGHDSATKKKVFGKEATQLKGKAMIGKEGEVRRYPVKRGALLDWNDMQDFWEHIYYHKLRVHPGEHPVLLSESFFHQEEERKKIPQIMFETFSVPAMYLSLRGVLSLLSSGRMSGVVLESSDGLTSSIPCYMGFALPWAIQSLDFGGRDLTKYLAQLLNERNALPSTCFRGDEEESTMRIVEQIKKKVGYVASDYDREMETAAKSSSTIEKTYELPDGKTITVGDERFRCAEPLFQPSLIGDGRGEGLLLMNQSGSPPVGISRMVCDTVESVPFELQIELYQNIVFSGGNTMLPGICDRMQRELTHILPPSRRIKIISPPERNLSPWIGGSILASLSTFSSFWVSQEEYNESGPIVVNRKCF